MIDNESLNRSSGIKEEREEEADLSNFKDLD